MPKFTVQIGRDATVYFRTVVEADSLDEVRRNVRSSGFICPMDTVWEHVGFDAFDNVETAEITSEDNSIITYDSQEGWDDQDDEAIIVVEYDCTECKDSGYVNGCKCYSC